MPDRKAAEIPCRDGGEGVELHNLVSLEARVMRRTEYCLRLARRMPATFCLGIALPAMLAAQVTSLQVGVPYSCPGGQLKVYSCTGPDATASCDVQVFKGSQAGPRGAVPRGQVMAMLQSCHLQTPAEAQEAARGGAPQQTQAQGQANGIKVGDAVEVLTGFGWTPAKILAINGNSYRVLANGIQVTKDYPAEVRRVGGATAQDHASGQYRLGDRVQVNVEGRWVESKIITEMGSDYQVELPGNRTAWASGQNLRPSTAPPSAPAAPKAGVPPKPGLTSCAGKVEGRYATTGSGFASFTITFRSGKATATDPGGNDQVFECWMGGEKIYLHDPVHPNYDMAIDVNNDGTLQTPLGEIKKKGN